MGESKFSPGEWKAVNATGDDLKKQIMPMKKNQFPVIKLKLLFVKVIFMVALLESFHSVLIKNLHEILGLTCPGLLPFPMMIARRLKQP